DVAVRIDGNGAEVDECSRLDHRPAPAHHRQRVDERVRDAGTVDDQVGTAAAGRPAQRPDGLVSVDPSRVDRHAPPDPPPTPGARTSAPPSRRTDAAGAWR